jgi:hypothetical protein
VTGKSIEEVQTSYLVQSKNLGAQVEGDYFHSLDARDLRNCRYYDEISQWYIKNNWVAFIYIHLKNSILCYVNPGSLGIAQFLGWNEDLNSGNLAANPAGVMGFIHGKSWKIICLTFVLVTYNIFLFILSVYGLYCFLIKLVSKNNVLTFDGYYIVTLVILILVLTFSLGANGNSARFKLPIFPFMLLFTSLGLTDLLAFLKGMKVRSNVKEI